VVDSVLPCGIPCVMVCWSDCAFCVCVDWMRLRKYDVKNVIVSVVKLNSCSSLWSSLLCSIVS
jgi:hypothetical protein